MRLSCTLRTGHHANCRPSVSRQHVTVQRRPTCSPLHASGTSADTAALIKELEQLVQTGSSRRVFIDTVKPNIDRIQELSAAVGANRVDPALNDGAFTGLLTTDLRQVTEEGDTTLGRISFNQFQPADLVVSLEQDQLSTADTAGVPNQLKGVFEGRPSSYVISFFFRLKDSPLIGLLSSIGTYEQSPDKAERLVVRFQKLRLRQAPTQAADGAMRAAWLERMRPHNPMMGEDGVAEVVLAKPPAGYLDYLVMLPQWHVSRGNFGSVVVLKRN